MSTGMITAHRDLLHISITKGGVGCRVGLQPLSLTTRSWLRPGAEPSWRAAQQRAAAGLAWSASALPSVLGRPLGLPASKTGLPEKTEMKGESMWKCNRQGRTSRQGVSSGLHLTLLSLPKKCSPFPTSSSYCSSHHRVALMSLTPNCEDPT